MVVPHFVEGKSEVQRLAVSWAVGFAFLFSFRTLCLEGPFLVDGFSGGNPLFGCIS